MSISSVSRRTKGAIVKQGPEFLNHFFAAQFDFARVQIKLFINHACHVPDNRRFKTRTVELNRIQIKSCIDLPQDARLVFSGMGAKFKPKFL